MIEHRLARAAAAPEDKLHAVTGRWEFVIAFILPQLFGLRRQHLRRVQTIEIPLGGKSAWLAKACFVVTAEFVFGDRQYA